jgi:NADPH:quinone reductase-like Zn-dependent oxidoreductase
MRAWVHSKRGNPVDILKLEEAWPEPVPTRERPILVEVKNAALNPV